MTILMDTSAIIAVFDAGDPNHARALEWIGSEEGVTAIVELDSGW